MKLQVQHPKVFEWVMHLRADMPRIAVNILEPHSVCFSSHACRQHHVHSTLSWDANEDLMSSKEMATRTCLDGERVNVKLAQPSRCSGSGHGILAQRSTVKSISVSRSSLAT